MSLESSLWVWMAVGVVITGTLMRLWKVPNIGRRRVSPHAFGRHSSAFLARHLPFMIACVGLVILGVALSRPYRDEGMNRPLKQGIDIMVLLDVSASMLIEDFSPNRLEAAKSTIQAFSKKLVNDRMGLIVYSAEAYVQYPLSFDHPLMAQFLPFVQAGYLKPGTAIGVALAHGVDRLQQSKSPKRSRLIILLTDGDNNTGVITPLQAAGMAKAQEIPVYTIGIGTEGEVLQPVFGKGPGGQLFKTYQTVVSSINHELLSAIAKETHGKFYKVDEQNLLSSVFYDIAQIEKSKLPTLKPRHRRVYVDGPLMWAAWVVLLISICLEKLWIRLHV